MRRGPAVSVAPANPIFIKKLPYDTLKDFAGVVHVGDIPLLLVLHPAVPAHSVRELIALVKATIDDPAIRARLSGDGVELVGGIPEETDAFIRAEMGRWPKIIKPGV